MGQWGQCERGSFVPIWRVAPSFIGRHGGVSDGQRDTTWISIPDALPWPAARRFHRRECQHGQSASVTAAFWLTQCHKPDQRHRSAEMTRLARRPLRSRYRQTGKKPLVLLNRQ